MSASKTKLQIWFAHAMCTYNRPSEAKELKQIASHFRKAVVVNPADYDDDPEKQNDLKNFCKRLVSSCDIVVFSRLLGKITAGVGIEINHALRNGIPVYDLADGQFLPVTNPVRYLNKDQTKQTYLQWKRIHLWRD
jgi:hypothetical protein